MHDKISQLFENKTKTMDDVETAVVNSVKPQKPSVEILDDVVCQQIVKTDG